MIIQQQFGTSARVLARTNDPDTSHQAAHKLDTTKLESMVYEAIRSFGPSGCISDEVRSKFPGYPYSSVTARFRALIDKGFIADTGFRRPGSSGRNQRVLKAIENGIHP